MSLPPIPRHFRRFHPGSWRLSHNFLTCISIVFLGLLWKLAMPGSALIYVIAAGVACLCEFVITSVRKDHHYSTVEKNGLAYIDRNPNEKSVAIFYYVNRLSQPDQPAQPYPVVWQKGNQDCIIISDALPGESISVEGPYGIGIGPISLLVKLWNPGGRVYMPVESPAGVGHMHFIAEGKAIMRMNPLFRWFKTQEGTNAALHVFSTTDFAATQFTTDVETCKYDTYQGEDNVQKKLREIATNFLSPDLVVGQVPLEIQHYMLFGWSSSSWWNPVFRQEGEIHKRRSCRSYRRNMRVKTQRPDVFATRWRSRIKFFNHKSRYPAMMGFLKCGLQSSNTNRTNFIPLS